MGSCFFPEQLTIVTTKYNHTVNLCQEKFNRMNKKLGERIKYIRKKMELNQKDFAVILDIAYPTLSKYEQGHRTPEVATLVKIAHLGQRSLDWLITGEGSKYLGEKETGNSAGDVNLGFEKNLLKISYAVKMIKQMGIDPENKILDAVQGDSMEPTLMHGDITLIDLEIRSFSGDGLYVISIKDERTIRRLQKRLDQISVLSDNRKYEPLHMDIEKFEQTVKIEGKVILIGKKT